MHIELTVELDAEMFDDWNWTNADAIKSQNRIKRVNLTEIGLGAELYELSFIGIQL